jgi:hypothetical protein
MTSWRNASLRLEEAVGPRKLFRDTSSVKELSSFSEEPSFVKELMPSLAGLVENA